MTTWESILVGMLAGMVWLMLCFRYAEWRREHKVQRTRNNLRSILSDAEKERTVERIYMRRCGSVHSGPCVMEDDTIA